MHGLEKAGKGWALHGAPRIAPVIEGLGESAPAFVVLAFNEGLTGLPLRAKGVEVLLQSLLSGLARVDRAPTSFVHLPKNLGPDQRAPVIARATSDKDRYR